MDDALGVRFALERRLTITGTLGVLVEAAQHGWVEIDSALAKLEQRDFRISPALLARARELAIRKPPVAPRRHQ